MSEQDRLDFVDVRPYVEVTLGTEPWLTVYEHTTEGTDESVAYFSALVPPEKVSDCLDDKGWDLLLGHGLPGRVYSGDESEYLRFGNDEGIEPLVFWRSFPSSKPSYLEVSEEFRHFFDLYEDRKSNKFLEFDDNGDEVEVIRMSPDKVQIRAKYLRDYLADRNMVLFLFFEFERHSDKTLGELGIDKSDQGEATGEWRYGWYIDAWPSAPAPAYSRLIGKKVVRGTPDYDNSLDAHLRNRKYEEFVIGVDGDGHELSHTCNEDALANYFGKNPGAPQYLTPVFFRKAVLDKYYGNPSEYAVDDGHVSRAGNWSLRVDNNRADCVIVYLGDLGHLAHKEQLYWKSFNVVPDGSLSDVAYRRGILGQWVDADEPALRFKAAFEQFREQWRVKFGWDLFKALKEGDEHYLTYLHVPTSENQKEFDDQVMALAKVLIERINEAEIAKQIALEKNDKGITKLGKYLESVQLTGRVEVISFLRNLNGLRSGPAHVKGADYARAANYFDLESKGLVGVFADILNRATALVEELGKIIEPKQEPGRG